MKTSENRGFQRFTQRNWRILDVLLDVAKQAGKSPAQVALNWAATQPCCRTNGSVYETPYFSASQGHTLRDAGLNPSQSPHDRGFGGRGVPFL